MMAADLHRAWRELPMGTWQTLPARARASSWRRIRMMRSLGCGGLIAALCQAGRPPVVAVLTDGAGSHPGSHDWPPESLREVRSQEVRAAAALLGLPADRLVLLRQPDSHAPHPGDDAFDAVVTRVRGVARDFGCDRILQPGSTTHTATIWRRGTSPLKPFGAAVCCSWPSRSGAGHWRTS